MKKKLNFLICVISIILAFTLLFSGCGDSATQGNGATPPTGNSETDAGGAQQAGGSSGRTDIIYGLTMEPATLDPSATGDMIAHMAIIQIYDSLLLPTPGDMNTPMPGIAESYEVNEAGDEYIFKIREGVKFHNGDTMTMDDVFFSMERALNSSFHSTFTASIEKWEVVDDTHLKLVLKYPYKPILQILSSSRFGIMSKADVEKVEGEGKEYGRAPIGTGPYKFVSWTKGDHIQLAANEDYWRTPASIKDLKLKFIADAATGDLANETGEIDFFSGTLFVNRPHLLEVERLQNSGGGSAGVQTIVMNVAEGPFTNKLVRQAVAYAIDKESIMLGAFEGYGTVADGFWCPYMWGYQEGFPGYQQDVEKAKELMKEAGMEKGFSTEWKTLGTASYYPTAEVAIEQIRAIGIDATLVKLEKAANVEQTQNLKQYEISNTLAYGNIADVDYIYTRFLHSSGADKPGNNYAKYVNKEVDQLIEAARVEQDDAKRKEAYWRINEIIKEDCPYIPWGVCENMVFANKDLNGFAYDGVERYIVYDWSWK